LDYLASFLEYLASIWTIGPLFWTIGPLFGLFGHFLVSLATMMDNLASFWMIWPLFGRFGHFFGLVGLFGPFDQQTHAPPPASTTSQECWVVGEVACRKPVASAFSPDTSTGGEREAGLFGLQPMCSAAQGSEDEEASQLAGSSGLFGLFGLIWPAANGQWPMANGKGGSRLR